MLTWKKTKDGKVIVFNEGVVLFKLEHCEGQTDGQIKLRILKVLELFTA